MNFKFILLVSFCLYGYIVQAQPNESFLFKGEWGFSGGINQYFGDLNPNNNFNVLNPSFNVYYRWNISKNFGLRFDVQYDKLSYSDQDNNQDYIEYRTRNLSFQNHTASIQAGIEFNFLKFTPGSYRNRFTPYLGLHLGLLYTNPFALDKNEEPVFLRPLITERLDLNDASEKYNVFSIIVPIRIGFKYNITEKVNIFGEVAYVFTPTDYLDDVSKNYAGIDAFSNNSTAAYFQDRSVGQIYGVKGKQRGTDSFSDTYFTARFGFSFNNLISCCPVPSKIRYY
ncbi:MAG: DUF6089 family protein [Alphaproteobacteria bacterium]|nr:DUF6089 family protein [Alphaproteobacteria bacterium]